MVYWHCSAAEQQVHQKNEQMAEPVACKFLLSSSFVLRNQKSTLMKSLNYKQVFILLLWALSISVRKKDQEEQEI